MSPTRAGRFVRLSLCSLAALVLLTITLSAGEMWRLLLLPSLHRRHNRRSDVPPPKCVSHNSRIGDNTLNTCSLQVLDASAIPFRSTSSQFYATLQQLAAQLPGPPKFANDHAFLCGEHIARREQWASCLPLSGRTDELLCANASRDDLLRPEPLPQNQICYASVLHMILVYVYEEFTALDAKPVLLYGTLLGAVAILLGGPRTVYFEDPYEDPHELDKGVNARAPFPLNPTRYSPATTTPTAPVGTNQPPQLEHHLFNEWRQWHQHEYNLRQRLQEGFLEPGRLQLQRHMNLQQRVAQVRSARTRAAELDALQLRELDCDRVRAHSSDSGVIVNSCIIPSP